MIVIMEAPCDLLIIVSFIANMKKVCNSICQGEVEFRQVHNNIVVVRKSTTEIATGFKRRFLWQMMVVLKNNHKKIGAKFEFRKAQITFPIYIECDLSLIPSGEQRLRPPWLESRASLSRAFLRS